MRNKWLLSFLIALLTLQTISSTVFAETENFNVKDGEYTITVKALHAEKDEPSGIAGYIGEEATLVIQDGKLQLTIAIPEKDSAKVNGVQIEGEKPVSSTEDVATTYHTYDLATLSDIINGQVQYEVPGIHKGDVPFRLHLTNLDELPVEEAVKVTEVIDLEDGTYNINAAYLKTDSDETSAMGRYLDKNVSLSVEDGKVQVTVTVLENETVTLLQLDGKDAVEMKVDADKRYETFAFDSLEALYDAYVEYEAPYNGSVHYGKANFQVSFDETSVVESDASEETETDADESQLEEGYYTINAAYLKTDSNDPSTMGRYLDDNVFLSVEDGSVQVIVTVLENETVTLLQLDGKDAVEKKVDGDKRYETFVFDSLEALYDAYVEYQAPYNGSVHYGKANFQVSFDETSVVESDASEKPGAAVEEEGSEEVEESDKPSPVDPLLPNKAFEVGFIVKHDTEDKASAANDFFLKPATLLEKDGEHYVQVTVTNSNMIDSLKTANGDMVVVKENADGSMVVQFKVDGSLSDMIELEMTISVPGVYEGAKHEARLFLDVNTMKEVDASAYRLVSSDNANGPTVEQESNEKPVNNNDKDTPGNNNDKDTPVANDQDQEAPKNDDDQATLEKPEFGSNDDQEKANNKDNAEQATNPQTGDTTSIIFYVLLLVGSAIPLAIKLRRRFV